jgi:hypothetical protein
MKRLTRTQLDLFARVNLGFIAGVFITYLLLRLL